MVIQEAHDASEHHILDIFYSVFCSLSSDLEFSRLQGGADQHWLFIIILPLGPEDAELAVFNKPPTIDRINSKKSKRGEVPTVT